MNIPFYQQWLAKNRNKTESWAQGEDSASYRHNISLILDAWFEDLSQSNQSYDYFVNWDSVRANVRDYRDGLHLLNGIFKEPNPKEELRRLLQTYPSVVAPALPTLLALRLGRDEYLHIATDRETKKILFRPPSGGTLTAEQIEDIVVFAEQTGLLSFLKGEGLSSVRDYAVGVNVGLDSNGRKNRTGQVMERRVGSLLQEQKKELQASWKIYSQSRSDHDQEQGFCNTVTAVMNELYPQDNPEKKAKKDVPDFIVDTGKHLWLIEVNYYNKTGSKLKSVAGEFCNKIQRLKVGAKGEFQDKLRFCWITDGVGWRSEHNSLFDAFCHIDYVFHLAWLCDGIFGDMVEFEGARGDK